MPIFSAVTISTLLNHWSGSSSTRPPVVFEFFLLARERFVEAVLVSEPPDAWTNSRHCARVSLRSGSSQSSAPRAPQHTGRTVDGVQVVAATLRRSAPLVRAPRAALA